jgi:hypothetical protein
MIEVRELGRGAGIKNGEEGHRHRRMKSRPKARTESKLSRHRYAAASLELAKKEDTCKLRRSHTGHDTATAHVYAPSSPGR